MNTDEYMNTVPYISGTADRRSANRDTPTAIRPRIALCRDQDDRGWRSKARVIGDRRSANRDQPRSTAIRPIVPLSATPPPGAARPHVEVVTMYREAGARVIRGDWGQVLGRFS